MKLTLTVPDVNGGELLMDHVAVVKGDEIKFTFQEFSATRVK